MMKMKKFLAAALALTMVLALAACGSGNSSADTNTASGSAEGKTVVTVATSPDFPPFESLDGSEVVGIEVDILQAITEKLGMEMKLEQMDFESVIPGVQAGKFDIGMSGITITEDRQKNCDFTQPYFLASQAIVVTPDSDITCKADLEGKTISVQTGTTAEEYCMENGYEVLAFAANNDAMSGLHVWAKTEFNRLIDAHRTDFAFLTDTYRQKYDEISTESNPVSKHTLHLVDDIGAVMNPDGQPYTNHLYVDPNTGIAKIKLNTWEDGVLREEMRRPDFVCWLRNVSRAQWALCLPYDYNGEKKGFYPDMMIVRKHSQRA